MYREVVPLVRGAAGHAFVGRGPVVDFAVRMRRLAEEDSASILAAQGRLTAAHVQALGETLGRAYAGAAPRLDQPGLGREAIVENYRQLLPYAGLIVDGAVLRRAYEWQREAVAALELPLLDRAARGRLREGHGDLRLEHVYFPGGEPEAPVVIDPLEAGGADPALDVAFLVTELEGHLRPDLAAAFLTRFAAASNDFDLYPLLDLYASHRAARRARVACLVAADPATAPAKASRKAAEASGLLAQAASYA